MSVISRLTRIVNVAARYRLDEYLQDYRGGWGLGWFCRLWGPIVGSGSTRQFDKHKRLRLALEELGPIYIKLGQLLSTRRDFLNPDLANELQGLQDRVPPFHTPDIETLVSSSLGFPAATVFSHLASEPLASASVAQVHSAQLVSGEEVVVKVLRPGIEKTVRADIDLLKWLARQIEKRIAIGKRLRPVEVINDYEKIILGELDLLAEGGNASQLKRNFENSDQLHVPKVYWDFSRPNVLVMERIHGIPVADVDTLQSHGINLKKLAETGVEIFFTQVFDHSFFHADMHPGNIFVNPLRKQNPQYIAIDCAIIGSLSRDDQLYLAKNLLAIFKRDYRKVAELHVECGWVPPDTPVAEFESAMRTVCEPIFEKPLKDISFGQLLVQLFSTAGKFNMEVQPSLVLLQKTLLNIEGLGRQLYPELDLWKTALPFLEKWNNRRLSPIRILERVKENLPDWIDRLPDIPGIMLDGMPGDRQMEELKSILLKQQAGERQRTTRLRKRLGILGVVAIASALIALHPAVNSLSGSVPWASAILGLLGILLLVSRP